MVHSLVIIAMRVPRLVPAAIGAASGYAVQPSRYSALAIVGLILLAVAVGLFAGGRKVWKTKLHPFLRRRQLNRMVFFAAPIALSLIWPPDLHAWKELFAGETDPLKALIIGLVFILIVALQIIAYAHTDQSDREAAQKEESLEMAKKAAAFNSGLAKAFLKVVGTKASRVRKCVEASAGKLEVPASVRGALNPKSQIQDLVLSAHEILAVELGDNKTLEVALFGCDKNRVWPIFAFNGHDVTDGLERKCAAQTDLFDLRRPEPPCLVVWVAKNAMERIVEGANVADQEAHDPYVRLSFGPDAVGWSLFAAPVRRAEGGPVQCVLVISTDKEKFFTGPRMTADGRKLLVDNFSQRSLFELDMLTLIH